MMPVNASLRMAIAAMAMAWVPFAPAAGDSGYNWFYSDQPTEFGDGSPFGYCIDKATPENAACRIDISIDLAPVEWASLAEQDTTGMQAGIVRLEDDGKLVFAVLTDDGWERVGNDGLRIAAVRVPVSAEFDYAADPAMVTYSITDKSGEHVLTNVSGEAKFFCANPCSTVGKVVARGEGMVESLGGSYGVKGADLVEVAAGETNVLAKSLAEYTNATFQVSGGGTLVIRGAHVPVGGVTRNLYVDEGSAVIFDLADLSPIPSIVRLFNNTKNDFSIGDMVTVRVEGEGTERISGLFMEGDNLEARIAEPPSFGGKGQVKFVKNGKGESRSACVSFTNAVRGFWYSLERAEDLESAFRQDSGEFSTRECDGRDDFFLMSSPDAGQGSSYYRVRLSAEYPYP